MPGFFAITGGVAVNQAGTAETVAAGWTATLTSNYPKGVPLPDGSNIDYLAVRTITLLSDGSLTEDGATPGISLPATDPAVFATPLQWTIKPAPFALSNGQQMFPKPWTFDALLDGESTTLGALTPVVGIPLTPTPGATPWASVTGKPVIAAGDTQADARAAIDVPSNEVTAWIARHPGRPVPAARVTYYDKPDTAHASLPTVMDTGQAGIAYADNGTDHPFIAAGAFQLPRNASAGNSFEYTYCDAGAGNTLTRIGATFKVNPAGATTDTWANAIAIANAPQLNGGGTAYRIGLHLSVGTSGWGLSKVSNATGTLVNDFMTDVNGVTTAGFLKPPLVEDGFAEYAMEIWKVGNTAVVILPDGQRIEVVDSDIGGWATEYGFVELTMTARNTDKLPNFTEFWYDVNGTTLPGQGGMVTRDILDGNISPEISMIRGTLGGNVLQIADNAGAANYIGVSDRVAGSAPYIYTGGTDANVGGALVGKGAGKWGDGTSRFLTLNDAVDNTDGTITVGSVKAMETLPVAASVITASTAPAIGKTTYYNASGGNLAPSMPALSGLSVGARLALRRDPLDTSAYTITFSLPGGDTFYSSGSTSFSLPISGEQREYQVVQPGGSGSKYWAPAGPLDPVGQLDARYMSGVFQAKNYGAKGTAVQATAGMTASSAALTLMSGGFTAADVGKVVVVEYAGTTRSVSDGAITAGTAALTSATASFTSADVRSQVTVAGAGAAGATLTATILAVTSATAATLSVNASTTVSGATTKLQAYLHTTISSVTTGVATLAASAGSTVSGAKILYGIDESAFLQAALNAATAAGGGEVVIPAGNYLTLSAVNLVSPAYANNVTIRGSGAGATTIFICSTVAGTPVFMGSNTTTGPPAPLVNFTMHDITLDGQYMQVGYQVDNCGVRSKYHSGCTFRDMVIQNTLATGLGTDYMFGGSVVHNVRALSCGAGSWKGASGGGSAGIGIATGQETMNELTISDCYASGNGTYGFLIETGATGVYSGGVKLIGCEAEGNGIAGYSESGGSGSIYSACRADNNLSDGFASNTGTTTTGAPGPDTIYCACLSQGNGRYGFSYGDTTTQHDTTARITWIGCKSISNVSQGFNLFPASGNTLDGADLVGCEAYQNGASGVIISNSAGTVKNVTINGGSFHENGQTSGTDHYGIRVNGLTTNLNIRGVKAYDDGGTQKQTYGIYLASGVTISGCVIEGNDLQGNLTGGLLQSATLSGVARFKNNAGYNPVGSSVPGTAFAIGATTVPATNNTGVDGTLYVTAAGTVTAVSVNGVAVSGTMAVGDTYRIAAGGTLALTYSGAPTLVFVGD